MPRPAFPLRIGIAGDPGQLINSTLTIDILVAQKPDVLLMTGDMAYADSGTSNVRGKGGRGGREKERERERERERKQPSAKTIRRSLAVPNDHLPPHPLTTSHLTLSPPHLLPQPKQFTGIEGFSDPYQYFTEFGIYQNAWGGRWDSFTRLWKALLSSVPTVTTLGNHEIVDMEPKGTPFFAQGEKSPCQNFGCNMTFTARQKAYNARFPVPTTPEELASGPSPKTLSSIVAADPVGTATNNAWSVREVANVATIITMSNYIFNDDFTAASEQFQWLKSILPNVNRTKTPWLIVMWHNPW